MIYELRTYTLMPGKQAEYVKLSTEVGRKIRGDRYGTFEGGWTTEFGTLNQYVHLWSYPSLDERARLRAELARNDEWTKGYLPQIRPMLLAQENKILVPVLPLKRPADGPHVYELRWYRGHVGRIGEWLELFKAIMPVREKYSKNVGVWQTDMGTLNEAVHLWAYRDLNERAAVRARALQDPEWQAFIGKATPLLQEMKSVILNPVPHSPLA
ncbi:MAG: NIPSNAP family protein [Candidatus Rokubacteria bacterium]|nr:NIPSNAP family protein [Candidatus Rokubacteria bacterium]HXG03635.1 NIPSNAP family protein [Candidatus Binatia bacterium]